MGKIQINGLEFHAFHGFFEEEQKIGGKYLVDIEIDTNFNLAETEDDLNKTIDYSKVAAVVDTEMKIKSKLIEHVAGRISERLIENFSVINHLKVKVTKVNPPIGIKLSSVSVEVEKER